MLYWRPFQVAGFVGLGFPEYLVKAVRHRYDTTQQPRQLHVVAVAACGDGKGRGLDELAVDGLITTATFGWAGLSPKLLKLITDKKVDAWNLPLGVGEIATLISLAASNMHILLKPLRALPARCASCLAHQLCYESTTHRGFADSFHSVGSDC